MQIIVIVKLVVYIIVIYIHIVIVIGNSPYFTQHLEKIIYRALLSCCYSAFYQLLLIAFYFF